MSEEWPAVPDSAGEIMAAISGGPDPRPGPPREFCTRSGKLLYREPSGPACTLTERPIADVVAEAGFGPVPERIEITADFCQCPACKEARYEP